MKTHATLTTKLCQKLAKLFLTSSLLLVFNSYAAPDNTPSSMEQLAEYNMHYEAEIEGFDVQIERQLTQIGKQQFRVTQEATARFMSLNEKSDFSLQNGLLVTQNYSYKRRVFGFNKDYSVNWQTPKRAIHKHKKEQKTLNSPSTLYSLLSYQTEIRRRLLAGNTDLHLNLVSKSRVRDYNFELAGEEAIRTKTGTLNTVKIVRNRPGKDKKTTIWLAKDFQYVIIRIMHYEDGSLKYRLDFDHGTLAGVNIN